MKGIWRSPDFNRLARQWQTKGAPELGAGLPVRQPDHPRAGRPRTRPQRRPAARRKLNRPYVIEHQGRTLHAIAKDISTSGLGIEQASGLVPEKVVLVEFADRRCLAGIVVWAKGSAAGLKFDRPLALDDPLLTGK